MGNICQSTKQENEGKPYFNAPINRNDFYKLENNQETDETENITKNNNFEEQIEGNKPYLTKYKPVYTNKNNNAYRSVAGATLVEVDTIGNSMSPGLNKPSKIFDVNNSINPNWNVNEEPFEGDSEESSEIIVNGIVKKKYIKNDEKEIDINEPAKYNGLYTSNKINYNKLTNQADYYNNLKNSKNTVSTNISKNLQPNIQVVGKNNGRNENIGEKYKKGKNIKYNNSRSKKGKNAFSEMF